MLVRACVRTYVLILLRVRTASFFLSLLSPFSFFRFPLFLFSFPATKNVFDKIEILPYEILSRNSILLHCSPTSPCNVPIWNTNVLRALKKNAICDGKSLIVAPAVQDDIFRTSQQTRLVKAAAIVHSHVAQDSIPLLIISHSDW